MGCKNKTLDIFFDLFDTSFQNVRSEIEARFCRKNEFCFTNFLILRAFSVGRAPIKVSLVLLLAWVLLVVHSLNFDVALSGVRLFKGFTFAVFLNGGCSFSFG